MNTWLTAVITSIVFGVFVYACSGNGVDTAGNIDSSCYGPDCPNSGSSGVGGSPTSTSLIGNSNVDAGTSWSPLCGPESAGCLPDPDAGSCSDMYDATGAMDGGVDSTGDGGTNQSLDASLTCRILQPIADSQSIERVCELAGSGKSGDPCLTTVDCGSGLTCVAQDSTGICRPYCCADPESCPSKSYCTTRSTLVSHDPWVLGADVPVCVPADNCPLTDPYPCPQDQNCICSSGKACMVVRRQGLTACVKPGDGKQGDYCPCAAGYVCSNTTFTCLKLCLISPSNTSNGQASTNSTCDTGTSCQSSNDVPPDWGVCSDVPLLID